MDDGVFSPEQLDRLTDEINQQLRDLSAAEPAETRAKDPARPRARRQRELIEKATQQDAAEFLARFRAAARKDLCEQGGLLHAQWQRFHDLASKDMLKTFGGILVGMGLAGSTLATVAVAISVYVLYLGIEAFCAGEE
jgi:hypothetical protein